MPARYQPTLADLIHTTMNYPLDKNLVDNVCRSFGLMDAHELGNATIRQMVGIIREIEQQTGCEYVHMELGNPGLPAEKIGVEAQIAALRDGCANKYPLITGIPELTEAASQFIKAFLGLNIPASCIVPTVGSMQGCFALDTIIRQLRPDRDTILFLDPCFPVQKQQCRVIGLKIDSIDIGDHRGERLRDVLEAKLRQGNIAAILYSNPNNPSWMCLTEQELRTIGQLANRYDTIVIEDVAYLNMDFRDPNRGKPFCAPYQPTVGRYTMNCVHLVSCSKIFSYAGERAAVIAVHPDLAHRHFPPLTERYHGDGQFMRTLVYQVLYAISSGMSHSVQYAMAAMFNAACEGKINFVANTHIYAERAKRIKEIMEKHHFHVVYDRDADDRLVGDGFFFTFTYRDWTGEQLLNKLIYYGVSAISLLSTGAVREGMRGCASAIRDDQYDDLDERLALFDRDFAPDK